MTNEKNLEEKAKFEEETGKKLPDILIAYCLGCLKEQEFNYHSIQPGYGPVKSFANYNCSGCGTTRNYNTLMNKFNGKAVY